MSPRYPGTLHDAPPLPTRMEPERIICALGATLGEYVEAQDLLLNTLVQCGVERWIYSAQWCVGVSSLSAPEHHWITLN